MKYTTCYTSSNGQPSNGHEEHDTLNAALIAWAANIRSVIPRSGGSSDLSSESGSVSWLEHCEGGFACADGEWSEEISALAQYEQSNGNELTPALIVRRLSA
jgi:hypothetical protein